MRVVGHHRSVRRWRFPSANLRKIPTRKFKKGQDCQLKDYYHYSIEQIFLGEDDFDSCAICLDDYEDGEKLRLLPCSHGMTLSTCLGNNNHDDAVGLQCIIQNVLILG